MNPGLYVVKQLAPRWLQVRARQVVARRLRPQVEAHWPVLEEAARPPPGWTGWSGGKQFALVLTHDVDTACGLARCRQLAELERQRGYRSSFNFVPKGRYVLEDSLRLELAGQGFEIGVHGLYHDWWTFLSRRTFDRRADRIRTYLRDWNATGFRAPSTVRNLDWIGELGCGYDSSTFDTDPFEPQPGGSGTIFPFWVESRTAGRRYVELPYTLPQDFTIFVLLGEQGCGLWRRKLDWIAERGGMALVLTHPDYQCFTGRPGPEEYPVQWYADLLDYARTRYGDSFWQALPREVARHHEQTAATRPARSRRHVAMLAYAFYDNDNRIIRYAETLARRGDQVDVIALRRAGQPRESWVRGVRVLRIQERERNERHVFAYLLRMLRFLATSARTLARLQRSSPYDVVHVHSVPDFEVFAAWPARRAGARVILDIHDIVPEFYASKFKAPPSSLLFRLLLRIERWSAAYADHVIIANHIWQRRLVARSVPAEKCSVVLNHVDTGLFWRRPRQRTDDRFRVVYPGGLQAHQGLDVAIRAFALLREKLPSAEFHVYGEGSEKDALEQLVRELDVGAHVLLHPMVPHRDVPQVMADADLGLVPKRADSFGNEAYSTKILEFMSQGVPVLASRTMIDTFYFQEPALMFFTSGDSADLAERIIRLAGDPALRRHIVASADVLLAGNQWQAKQHEYLALVDALSARRNGTA